MAKRLQIRVGGLFTADVDEVGIRASRYGLQQQPCAGEAGFGPGGQQAWQECDEFVEVANEMADKLAVFIPAERELDRLGQQEKTSLLVEGGSQVHGAFFDGKLAQRIYAFSAPCLIGGKRNLSPIGGRGARNMDLRVTLLEPHYEAFGTDLMVTGLLERS